MCAGLLGPAASGSRHVRRCGQTDDESWDVLADAEGNEFGLLRGRI
jgi:hypothetical protein